MKDMYRCYSIDPQQIRLWKWFEALNADFSIAVYNKTKKRIYIHSVEYLTDDDIEAITWFIKEMKKEGVSDEKQTEGKGFKR